MPAAPRRRSLSCWRPPTSGTSWLLTAPRRPTGSRSSASWPSRYALDMDYRGKGDSGIPAGEFQGSTGMGQAGGMLCAALAHPLLFPGQRSREEQAAGKDGQQSSLGTDSEFSMEENSLYSSRGKGRLREVGKVQRDWVGLHKKQCMSCSTSASPLSQGTLASFAPESSPRRGYVQEVWWKVFP